MNSWITLGMHPFQDAHLAGLLVDNLLKSLFILLVAGVVCLSWRRSTASTRHLLWFLALTGLLCLPVISHWSPTWERPLWALSSRVDSLNELTLTLQLAQPTAETRGMDHSPALAPQPGRPMTSAQNGAASQSLALHFTAPLVTWTLTLWLTGMVLVLLYLGLGYTRLERVRRTARPISNSAWCELLNALCAELKLHRPVTLLQSPDEVMPVTWGWFKPVILLPAQAEEWSAERRRLVLLHELAHVKRWDCLTQLLARVACAVYWFNPLAWVAAWRMCVERERACDDLVLKGGYKASDYAAHLVHIAGSFRRLPQAPAIAIARKSNLESRIAAIVDASRPRGALGALVVCLCCAVMAGLIAAVAAQKSPENTSAIAPSGSPRPWFDERLRAFFAAKAAQARQLSAGEPVAPEVWPYFDAGRKGDWNTATNLWLAMRQRAHQYEGTTPDATLDKVWSPILETDLAFEQFANWKEKYVLGYGNDIIASIPHGSIYFGGTDPGRGVITAMSEAHADGKPFFTITQNALADGTYLEYLRAMYGGSLHTPSEDDSQKCFQEYSRDAEQRLKENKLKPNENVTEENGKVQVKGQVAVMSVNALIAKLIFERNPAREFYIEESFPLEWMYAHLLPNGLIMKINREPLTNIPDEIVQQDHDYWSQYLQPMLGDWLNDDTSVAQETAVVEKLYLDHDLSGFTGDPQFLEDSWAQKAFSKLRSSIAGVYAWRVANATNEAEKQRMARAADFGFRQAFALCPTGPEVVFRYVNLLVSLKRVEDARSIVQTSLKLDPHNRQLQSLVENLQGMKAK